MDKLTDKLFTVKYNEDTGKPHIEITDQNVCLSRCTGKYCTHFCPAGVYEWNEEQKKNLLDRLPFRQHRLPRPPGRLRRPLSARIGDCFG